MNDESVSGAKLENVLNEQAYILFYVKRGGPAAPVVKKQAKVTNGKRFSSVLIAT